MTPTLEETLRIEGGRVLATLTRLTGDLQQAEDALQEASIEAIRRWREQGVPRNPAGWLMTVARNKALDRLRRESARGRKEQEAMSLLEDEDSMEESDASLRLFFTACHPALSPEARVALSLRTLGGLTTGEIARSFLVAEPTMGQRISRAKKKIALANIPYRIPDDHELPERLPAVLAVLYVIFATGHHPATAELDARVDLAEEGIRLARLLHELMPDEPEATGLLALMLSVHARTPARLDAEGNAVLLAEQDRSQWDRAAIGEASQLLSRALRRRSPGPYQIQAAISCLHGTAESFADTDWPQIVKLYRLLEQHHPTPVVRVNRAVAEAEVAGPEVGLALIEGLEGVDRWHLFWSTKAEFLRRLGRLGQAEQALRQALECELNESDRRLLEGRLLSLSGPPA